jgi:hypothetical protein
MQPCIHEAGHAVVAHLLDCRVAFVLVARDGSGESRIAATEPRCEVVGRLAGRIAEERYWDRTGGGPAECHPAHADTHDREAAWAAAQLACEGDLRAAHELLEESRATAAEMVDAEWTHIENVARAVYESPDRRLLGSVFLSMMGTVMRGSRVAPPITRRQ